MNFSSAVVVFVFASAIGWSITLALNSADAFSKFGIIMSAVFGLGMTALVAVI